jgi:hypothetical protein
MLLNQNQLTEPKAPISSYVWLHVWLLTRQASCHWAKISSLKQLYSVTCGRLHVILANVIKYYCVADRWERFCCSLYTAVPVLHISKRLCALTRDRPTAVFLSLLMDLMGACGSIVVKALCYKPEGRGLDTRWGDFFLNLPTPSGRTRPWGLLSL